MMERRVNRPQIALGARRQHAAMPACPHCGGNVRSIRDIYGAYLQCLQCSREIEPAMLTVAANDPLPVVPVDRPAQELLIA